MDNFSTSTPTSTVDDRLYITSIAGVYAPLLLILSAAVLIF